MVTDIDGLCGQDGARPDLVVECAGQGSVKQYGKAVLQRGVHLAVISTGAFADLQLHQACNLCDVYTYTHIHTHI